MNQRVVRLRSRSVSTTANNSPNNPVNASANDPTRNVSFNGSEVRLDRSATQLARESLAEAIGTFMLIVAVIGSGIMAQRLSPNDVGLQLLENAVATGGALIALILMLGGVSGAHFNPAVTLSFRYFRQLSNQQTFAFICAQIIGGCFGAMFANIMFSLPVVNVSTKSRATGAIWASEVFATVGLLLVIHGIVRSGKGATVPFAVGAWITGAYWFTSSTSFANPAVSIARTLSNTFAGIKPASSPMFIAMQIVGVGCALPLIRFLYPSDLSDVRNQSES